MQILLLNAEQPPTKGRVKKALKYGAFVELILILISASFVMRSGNHSGMYVSMILHLPSSLLAILTDGKLVEGNDDINIVLVFAFVVLLQFILFSVICFLIFDRKTKEEFTH
jgi:hypothetical protein